MIWGLDVPTSLTWDWDNFMTRVLFSPPIGPEFDPFLCAFIGADPNGTLLSVLSAFARTDVDPWKEAAQLARMPRESATARLTEFILTLPNEPYANKPARTVAGELIALLPETSRVASPAPGKLTKTAPGVDPRLWFSLGTITVVLAGFVFLFWINRAPEPPARPLPASAKMTTLSPRELGR